jgi:predicted transposase YdaD
MEKISWTSHVRNEGVLQRVEEVKNCLRTVKRRKSKWIGLILRRNVTEGKIEGRIEVTRRRGRRSKQVLDDLEEKRGYWNLKEEALDRTLWRTGFGRGCGSVMR